MRAARSAVLSHRPLSPLRGQLPRKRGEPWVRHPLPNPYLPWPPPYRHPDESQDPDRKAKSWLLRLQRTPSAWQDKCELPATAPYELGPDFRQGDGEIRDVAYQGREE